MAAGSRHESVGLDPVFLTFLKKIKVLFRPSYKTETGQKITVKQANHKYTI